MKMKNEKKVNEMMRSKKIEIEITMKFEKWIVNFED